MSDEIVIYVLKIYYPCSTMGRDKSSKIVISAILNYFDIWKYLATVDIKKYILLFYSFIQYTFSNSDS